MGLDVECRPSWRKETIHWGFILPFRAPSGALLRTDVYYWRRDDDNPIPGSWMKHAHSMVSKYVSWSLFHHGFWMFLGNVCQMNGGWECCNCRSWWDLVRPSDLVNVGPTLGSSDFRRWMQLKSFCWMGQAWRIWDGRKVAPCGQGWGWLSWILAETTLL